MKDKHDPGVKKLLRCDGCSYQTRRVRDLQRHKLSCSRRKQLGLNPPLQSSYTIPKTSKPRCVRSKYADQTSTGTVSATTTPMDQYQESPAPLPGPGPEFCQETPSTQTTPLSQPTTSEPELPPAPEAAAEPVVNQFEPGSGDEALYNLLDTLPTLDSLAPPMTPLIVTVDPATSHQQVTVGNSARASAPSSNTATVSAIPPATTSSSSSSMTYNVPDTDMDFMDGDQEPRTSAIGQTCQATLKLARLLGEERKRTVDLETRKHGLVIVKTLETCKFPDGTVVKYAAEKTYHPPASDYFKELGFL